MLPRLLVVVIVMWCTPAIAQYVASPIVQTTLGPIVGETITTKTGARAHVFRGIHMARVPLRFGASVLRTPWTTTQNASEFGAACPQSRAPAAGITEDCVRVKVVMPAGGQRNLPAVYWPHGGGFSDGSNHDFDITRQVDNMVSKNVSLASNSIDHSICLTNGRRSC